jgi:hypothetical protein
MIRADPQLRQGSRHCIGHGQGDRPTTVADR